MRKGGGHHKGSQWERETGKMLSLWLTHDERPDIFARNVLSGGAFTLMEKQGKVSSRMPGDLTMAHPLAFRFLSKYMVECKHLRDIGLVPYLLDPRSTTPLGRIISLAERQADRIGVEYMIIAKQNHYEPIMLISGAVGNKIIESRRQYSRATLPTMHHTLHNGKHMIFRFRDFLRRTDPDLLLGETSC